MTTSTDTATRARTYVAAVDAALSHLPADQRVRLTAGLVDHLQEIDDDGLLVLDQQPSPQQYASELLAAAPVAATTWSGRSAARPWALWVAAAAVLAAALVVAGVLLHGGVSTQPPQATSSPPANTSPATVTMPDLVGLSQSAASAELTSAGLQVGQVHTQSTNLSPSGTVISTSPAAGSKLLLGTRVNLVVATR